AGDELVAAVHRPDHERLKYPVVLDAGRQRRQFFRVELLARLVRVVRDLGDREPRDALGRGGNDVAEEGVQPAGQAGLGGGFHASFASDGLVWRGHSKLRARGKWKWGVVPDAPPFHVERRRFEGHAGRISRATVPRGTVGRRGGT